MKKTALFLGLAFSLQVAAGEIVATKEEKQALLLGMRGMMQRLADPAWIKLAREKGNGCWLDKSTLIKEGGEHVFNGVPSRCVSWDLGMPGHKAYIFMSTRLVEACDKAGKPYNTCVE